MDLRETTMKDDSFASMSRPGDDVRSGRRSFLRRGAVAAAAATAATAATFGGRQARANNPNYLPSLYAGENALEFTQIQKDENTHVMLLQGALGGNSFDRPGFVNLAQANLVAFASTAKALENTGTGAYLGAAPYISNPAILITAAQILPIEARHASYLNVLLNYNLLTNAMGNVPTNALEVPLTYAQVAANAAPFLPTGFSLPMYTTTPSAENDIRILQFALALEYLESSYYNLNLPNFM